MDEFDCTIELDNGRKFFETVQAYSMSDAEQFILDKYNGQVAYLQVDC